MRLTSVHKSALRVILAALFAASVHPALSQIVPQAIEGGLPLAVGGGFSYWDVDWAHSKMEGAAVWIDWRPNHVPHFLRGIGVEAEARDVSLNHGDKSANFRQDTGGVGLTYTLRRNRNFQIYGKGILALGSIDFDVNYPGYTHDTRTVFAPGGGIQYRVYKHIWARADYEYQFWPDFMNKTLDPQGFTFGAMYDFRHRNRP